MRIDVFLKKVLIFKQRTLAQKAIKNNLVRINYSPAKSSKEVKAGDIIEIDLPKKYLLIEVIEIPSGNVPKKDVLKYYKILKEEIKNNDFLF